MPLATTTKPSPRITTTQRFSRSMDLDIVTMLVKEITRSKDETIQCKEQMIQLLMSRRHVE